MPKAKTTTSTKAAKTATATKSAVPVKVAAKKAVAAPKKVAAKKVEPVATTPPPAPVSAAPVEDEVPTLTGDFTEFMAKLQQVSSLLSSLKSEFRSLEKKATRELKAAQKASAKRKRKAGNRSPSGFVKPTLISNELAAFLAKPEGTQMARTEVTREINAYIRANKLQDPENGRKINADTKLTSLLKLSPGDELTYFNLQKYMSPHFAKASKPVVASA
jgi:chromatin remodeling complex protein RSC6